jgi:hypothetical protein
MTGSTSRTRSLHGCSHGAAQRSLLHVEARLGLLQHQRASAVEHVVGHDDAAAHGQAVHEPARRGLRPSRIQSRWRAKAAAAAAGSP